MIRTIRLQVSKGIFSYCFVAFLFVILFILAACSDDPSKKFTLEDWGRITAIGSSVIALILAGAGLALGFYYYRSRLKHDKRTEKQRRTRQRMQIILEQLNSYDLFVKKILEFSIKDNDELTFVRDKIDQAVDQIEAWLEHNEKLLGLAKHEIERFLALNSWVDQSALIMMEEYQELNRNKLQAIKPLYVDLFRKARFVCMDRME